MGKIYYKDVSYGGGGSSTLDGSIVGVEQVQRSGNLIAVISVDEDDTNIYSPLPPLIDVDVNDISVLDPVTQTAKVYTHKSLTKAEYEAIPSSISHVSNIIYAITDEPKLYLNGVEYNGTGGVQTSVIVSPIATEGTKIASISVDGLINDIYAPDGGDEYVAGDNIIISTFSGQPSTISAVNTTYSAFTSTAAGLVPPPTTAVDMFLKSDGTWSEAGVGNVIDVYENGVSVLDENNIAQTHSYKEITQAEYDALYPPGSTVTDNILYAIKDGEGGSGGGGASALVDLDDVDISTPTDNQVLQYDSTSQKWINATPSGGGGGFIETNSSDYENLTPAEKADISKLYFLKDSGAIEVDTDVIVESYRNFSEGSVAISTNSSGQLTYTWGGGSSIGAESVYQVPIPASVQKVKFKITTGSSYSTTNPAWQVCVGLKDHYDIVNWIYPTDSNFLAKKIFATNNSVFEDEIDCSNISTDSYLYVAAHGWTMTVDYMRLTTEQDIFSTKMMYKDVPYASVKGMESDDYDALSQSEKQNGTVYFVTPSDTGSNKVCFMGDEYGGSTGGGGGTKTSIFTNPSTSNPATITFSKPITDYDFITFQIRAGSNAIATMTYNTSNLAVGDTIGAGFYTGIFAWYYLTDMQTLTYRVDAGGAYISDITGTKLGGGSGEGGSYSETILFNGNGNAAPSSVTLSEAYTDYDEIIFCLLRSADGRMYKYHRVYLVSDLNINDSIQMQTYSEYWGIEITSATVFTTISSSGMYVDKIVGIKH